jgi:adenylate cyclase
MKTVICPGCGEVCPVGKNFCAECGVPLPALCSQCGAELIPGKKFCADCGALISGTVIPSQRAQGTPIAPTAPSVPPVPAERAGAPEERRLVTALFCDLVGFTPLSESLDPEEVRDLQAAYFTEMAGQIERYGGTVEKYAGDAVLALFGAPIAHEDDAERAVLCALGMQATIEPVAATARTRWNVDPSIRVGVNTGEVVSGTWIASGRQDVAVTGDAVNTAARIQATAEPGEILVGAETMRLTRRRIRYGDRREVTLKGKVSLVPVWPALEIREEFGERWEGYETPLVGRDREMVQLLDAWVRAQAGEGQLVTVVGDAGVGKSRLFAEFLGTIAASSAARVLRARSLSYGQEISLWLVADLLRSLFGIKEQEGPDEVAAKLKGSIPALLTDPASRAEALDVLGEVLGLPIGESVVGRAGPQIRRHALIRSLRGVLGAVAERAPTVMVLEDLHWMDNASREVLTEVVADVLGLRMLVAAAQRPGWTAPWSEWGWPERITLRPLGERDAALLAGAVLGGIALGQDLERYVAERAGGNPFFVEEMLRALQETGGIAERQGQMHLVPGVAEKLPSTLTEVLLARLDRLEAQVRSVAQVASVIGRSFAVPLLVEVVGQAAESVDESLAQLQRAEIAFPRRNPTLEYVFKHVSMRDVAYNTLVQKRRQELHLQTARAIATLYPADEYVEMIAYHYGRTEVPEAAEWLERAGDRAAAVYANDEAIGHYGEARRRFEPQGAEQTVLARLEEKLGTVLYTAGRYDEALEHLGHAAEIARAQRDLEGAGRVVARMGMAHRWRGTPEEGIALVSPVIDLLSWSGPSECLVALHLSLANLFFLVGRYREVLAEAARAGEIARAIGNDRLLGEAEERRGVALGLLGQPEEALSIYERAVPLIEAGGDLVVLSRAFNNAAATYLQLGRMEDCRRYFEQALGIVERIGNPDQTAFILGNVGGQLITLGDWAGAREHLERAMALLGDERTALASVRLMLLGRLSLYQGRWEEAARWLGEALALVQRTGERYVQENVQALLAELDLLAGRPQAAIARLEELVVADGVSLHVFPSLAWARLEVGAVERAAEVVIETIRRARAEEQRFYLLEALRVQGMVLTRQERFEEAERAFQEGLELARSLPVPYAEARILYQQGLLDQQRGEPEQARERLKEALGIFRRLGAVKDVERTEQALTGSA